MIRVRFAVNGDDPRPVNWPIKHPYWVTGYRGDETGAAILVAYADDQDEILRNWPDAKDIDVLEEAVESYSFSDRFPRPEWLEVEVIAVNRTAYPVDSDLSHFVALYRRFGIECVVNKAEREDEDYAYFIALRPGGDNARYPNEMASSTYSDKFSGQTNPFSFNWVFFDAGGKFVEQIFED